MYGDVELIAGEDFEMKYADNTGLGTATAFINGINGFNFSEQLAFTIRLGNTPKVTCTNVASGMKVSWIKVGGATRYKVIGTISLSSQHQHWLLRTRMLSIKAGQNTHIRS